jgi:hypothetical protein
MKFAIMLGKERVAHDDRSMLPVCFIAPTIITINGERYRLKDKLKAGLLPKVPKFAKE